MIIWYVILASIDYYVNVILQYKFAISIIILSDIQYTNTLKAATYIYIHTRDKHFDTHVMSCIAGDQMIFIKILYPVLVVGATEI